MRLAGIVFDCTLDNAVVFAFSRGIPLFGTLLALLEDGEPVLGVIDCCAIAERTVGWKDGGCHRNGVRVRASQRRELRDALVSHGDVFCFDRAGQRPVFERMAREIPKLRGYTDAFGHAHTCAGGIDAMVDLDLNPWDMAATRILVAEAGQTPTVILSRYEQFNRFLTLGASSRQIPITPEAHDEILFSAGFTNGVYRNVPWIVDPKVCQSGQHEPPPAISQVLVYIVMAGVLVWRPTGLFGQRT